jgi:hypothetical protein
MAAPHVAGTVALLWSGAPALVGNIAATRVILDQSAISTSDLRCGGTTENNNVWGEGRLDAFAAVLQSPIDPSGVLQGTVTDYNDGLGISGATVRIGEGASMVEQVATGDTGFYRVLLPLGTYDIEASASGYQTGTVHVILDTNGATYVQNFALGTARGEVSPVSLTFLVPPGESRTRTLILSDTGTLPMDWQIGESYDTTPADVEWLAAYPTNGTVLAGGQESIQVTTNAASLELGGYLARIILQTHSGRQADLSVPVRLVVSPLHTLFLPVVQGGRGTD